MLVAEPRKRYYIYPSNCCFRYSFDELRTVLADPIGCSALSEGANYYRALDYPLDIQPFDMFPSRRGGGIIVAHAGIESEERWLPDCVLSGFADVTSPRGMEAFRHSDARSSFPAHVYVLEPQGEPFAEYPTRDGRKFQSCYVTPENVDWCENDIYWVMDAKPTRSTIRLQDALGYVAEDFQVDLQWLPNAPPPLKEQTRDWFLGTTMKQHWCRVSNVPRGVGLNFALTAFCAIHASNYVGGSNVRAIHLVASIEGQPNVRPVFWHPKRR